MKKFVLPLVTSPSIPAGPDPVRDALRRGLNQAALNCHRLSRNAIVAGLVAPPKGSSASAAAAPPIPAALSP